MTTPPHWADEACDRILQRPGPHRISTGISPSGPIHVGNLRETLTGDAIARVLRERGAEVRLEFVADDYDPLRRVYPFLDPAVYQPLVGRPLSDLPCPCERDESYADHFLLPYLATLRSLAIELHLERGSQMYASGRMNPAIVRALEQRDVIAAILRDQTGKEAEPHWSPFNPLCPSCRRITGTRVAGFSAHEETIDYACECGAKGTLPMTGGGKLTWRVDWPARWWILGVTVEPFGKDHASKGGSYDTGVRIVREVFGAEPPFPIPYEWIGLKGRGDMSSSKGNVISVADVLEVAPPDVLRYLILRNRPMRAITFDPGLPLLSLIDEYDDAHSKNRDARAVALSRASAWKPSSVPFKHLVVVLQIANFEVPRALEILRSSGYPDFDTDAVSARFAYATRWLAQYAPEEIKFSVAPALPPEASSLDPEQRAFLRRLASGLVPSMSGEEIHALVYELAKPVLPGHDPSADLGSRGEAGTGQRSRGRGQGSAEGSGQGSGTGEGASPARLFEAIYVALAGKRRGPRAGSFIGLIGIDFAKRRFLEAAGEP